jgi:hypothetical protein
MNLRPTVNSMASSGSIMTWWSGQGARSAGPVVRVLAVVDGVGDESQQVVLHGRHRHVLRPRVRLPRPAQVRRVPVSHGHQIRRREQPEPVHRDASVLAPRVAPGHRIPLLRQRAAACFDELSLKWLARDTARPTPKIHTTTSVPRHLTRGIVAEETRSILAHAMHARGRTKCLDVFQGNF